MPPTPRIRTVWYTTAGRRAKFMPRLMGSQLIIDQNNQLVSNYVPFVTVWTLTEWAGV